MEQFLHDAITAALGDEKVWALHQDADGGLWIGTRAHGLYRYRETAVSSTYTTANGLASDSIYCILEDKQWQLLVQRPLGRDAAEPRRTGCRRPQTGNSRSPCASSGR